jgi:hypothetical protein
MIVGSVKVDGRFVGPCCSCSSQIWLPEALYVAAKHSEKITFYCPYGHPQIFPQGDTMLTLVRRERDRLAQQMAMREDHIRQLSRDLSNVTQQRETLKRAAARTKKRIGNGVCPECNRTFENLQRHMHTKHGALQ